MGNVYQCLIVDDEKPAHMVLKSHIFHCENLEYAGSAYNGKEAIQMLLENRYDIVFLDINMPLINGVELMQTMSNRPATIITTAYDNFAFEAYQHDALDYLLKPISLPKFIKAADKARIFCAMENQLKNTTSILYFRIDGEDLAINVMDILYFESIGNYVKIHFRQKHKTKIAYETLKNIVNKTPSKLFIQTHKSYIINTQYLEKIETKNTVLTGNIIVPLGRKYELLVNQIKK